MDPQPHAGRDAHDACRTTRWSAVEFRLRIPADLGGLLVQGSEGAVTDRCPIHASTDDDDPDPWPCADESSGCTHWIAHIDAVIEDIRVNGNYVRTWVVDGVLFRQQMRNHQPVGDAKPMRVLKAKEQQ